MAGYFPDSCLPDYKTLIFS